MRQACLQTRLPGILSRWFDRGGGCGTVGADTLSLKFVSEAGRSLRGPAPFFVLLLRCCGSFAYVGRVSLSKQDKILATRRTRPEADDEASRWAKRVTAMNLQNVWGVYVAPYRIRGYRNWWFAVCLGRQDEPS